MPKRRRRSTSGSITRRGESTWLIRYYDRRTKRRLSETVHGAFEDADARLLDIQLGQAAPSRSMTFQDYWRGFVVPTFPTLAEKTAHEYERLWRTTLGPAIGGLAIGRTTWRDVQEVMDGLRDRPSTQRHAFALLRKVCNLAVRDRMLDRNPCDAGISLVAVKKRPLEIPDAFQARRIVEASRASKYHPLVVLCMLAGLRLEEAAALDWEDVRTVMVDGTRYLVVNVERTAVSIDGRMVEQERTKTASSTRSVLLSGWVAQELLRDRGRGPLVQKADGTRTSPGSVPTNYRRWCRRNGVQYVPIGRMRSVFATLACECVDSSLVSLAMGHSDGTTRGRNYQQGTLRGAAMVADAMAEYVGGALWEQNGNKILRFPRSNRLSAADL